MTHGGSSWAVAVVLGSICCFIIFVIFLKGLGQCCGPMGGYAQEDYQGLHEIGALRFEQVK
jgi:hypothetical protein